jgi:hypothetical protein
MWDIGGAMITPFWHTLTNSNPLPGGAWAPGSYQKFSLYLAPGNDQKYPIMIILVYSKVTCQSAFFRNFQKNNRNCQSGIYLKDGRRYNKWG